MNIQSLTAEIESSRALFHRLSDMRTPTLRRIEFEGKSVEYLYSTLAKCQEQGLTRLAERIDRLYRFRAFIAANNHNTYATPKPN